MIEMKIIKKIIDTSLSFVLIYFAFTLNINSQELKLDKNSLLGKWKSYKTTTLDGGDGSNVSFDGKPFDEKMTMNFIDSTNLLFSLNSDDIYNVTYDLENDKLTIVHRVYTIQKITDNKLILKEEKLFGNLIYLKKDDS